MSSVSTAILATSVFLTTLGGMGAGYMMSPPPVRSGDSNPIIDPDAWDKTGYVAPEFQAQAQPSVVDAAMTAAADDVNATGWAPPDDVYDADYQDADQTDDADSDTSAGYAVEQLDGAGAGDRGSSSITVVDKAESDRAWDSWPDATTHEASVDPSQAPTVTH